MCLGGWCSRSPIYQTYNYPTPPTPTIPVPEPPAPVPETENPSGTPVTDGKKKDELTTQGSGGHTGSFGGGTGSGTSGDINV